MVGCDYDRCPAGIWDDPLYRRQSTGEFLEENSHAVFGEQPWFDAEHIVRNYRSGVSIYSEKPVVKFCKEHIFWKWPDKIFENFDREYLDLMTELRGPANSVFTIPPVTLMVLSRAVSRKDIPRTIVDIRDEYAIDRKKLWEHLSEMWSVHSLKQKIKLRDDLEKAARSLFLATFPKTEGAFSFAIDVAENVAFGGLSGLKRVGDHLSPRIGISAVSLASRLSQDFARHLADDKQILKRHLTEPELRRFGMA